jgi:hypothetical protein
METEKNPYILQSEVGNTIKEMRDKTATGDDGVYLGMYSNC